MILTRRGLMALAGTTAALSALPVFAQDKGAVGIAMPTKSSSRWISDGDSMVKAFQEAGYTADLQYAEDDIPTQLSQIENMITSGVKALVIAAIDGTTLSNALDNARIDTAGKDIKTFVGGVEMYSIQKKGKCPKTLDDLKAAGVIKAINKDPWGNDYVLKCPGEHGDVDISSAGPDGEFGNEDDINSWDDEAAKDEKKE